MRITLNKFLQFYSRTINLLLSGTARTLPRFLEIKHQQVPEANLELLQMLGIDNHQDTVLLHKKP